MGARRRRLSVASADGSRVHAKSLERERFSRLARAVSSEAHRAATKDAVRASNRERSHRREDRPSRWTEPEPGGVFALAWPTVGWYPSTPPRLRSTRLMFISLQACCTLR